MIASERAQRPEQFKRDPAPLDTRPATSPFCPGNEHLTPPTIAGGIRITTWWSTPPRPEDEHKPYFLWHVEIRPRFATPAGFELGTGVFINKAAPEQTAAYFRPMVANELMALSAEAA